MAQVLHPVPRGFRQIGGVKERGIGEMKIAQSTILTTGGGYCPLIRQNAQTLYAEERQQS